MCPQDGRLNAPELIFGVDFSGADDAGRRIWIARGRVEDRTLQIESCYPGSRLPGSARARSRCLPALRTFIAQQGACAIGIDFPFSVPEKFIKGATWEKHVRSFAKRYPTPEAFRKACRDANPGRELKRETDRESQTPFSPYNLRLFRQTHFGIRDLLGPLVRDGAVCVLPMQPPHPAKPWLLEVCPASTLKTKYVYPYYKGREPKHRSARIEVLETIERTGRVLIADSDVRGEILDNTGGDALDAVIAAEATFRRTRVPASLRHFGEGDPREGYVYA